jgi:hypothetical protein
LTLAVSDRLAHSLAVGETCAVVAGEADVRKPWANLAVAAAYLHDIGYAVRLKDTGFHPIDGGRYLRGIGWDALVPFVAHHSQAFLQAEVRGLSLAEFKRVRGVVQDLVDYADVRTGPVGQRMMPTSAWRRLSRVMAPAGPAWSCLVACHT